MNNLIKWSKGVFGVFLMLLPTHTKRMMFMASYVKQSLLRNSGGNVAGHQKEIMTKLDQIFELCNAGNAEVMQVPDPLSKVIMQGVVVYDVEKPVTAVQAIAMAKGVRDQVPFWLRYKGIESDTALMLERMPVAAN